VYLIEELRVVSNLTDSTHFGSKTGDKTASRTRKQVGTAVFFLGWPDRKPFQQSIQACLSEGHHELGLIRSSRLVLIYSSLVKEIKTVLGFDSPEKRMLYPVFLFLWLVWLQRQAIFYAGLAAGGEVHEISVKSRIQRKIELF
jgi:hypothetical protein